MKDFTIQQIIHLTSKVIEYLYDDERKDYESSLSKYEIKDINPDLSSEENFEHKLNESEHIFKYIYALNKILQNLQEKKDEDI
tara:strand:+ start:1187 stop:1435 length:249 start_codon:yes stop_codon:yes gene_type:complete